MDEEVTGAPGGNDGYDRAAMARLTRMALRGRSIRDSAKEMGLSESMLSKLLNQKLKNRPTVNTLRKLNTGYPPELLRKMLAVCGYPLDLQEDMDAFLQIVKETPGLEDVSSGRMAWSVSIALAVVLESLTVRGYGSRFEIDYRADGLFAVDVGAEYPLLICVPLILTDQERKANKVMKLALEKMAQGITRWGLEETAVMILTDSPSVYRLLKHLPNRSKIMAVAMASGDRRCIERQCTILSADPLEDLQWRFPLDLSASGDELMTDA